MNRRAIPTPSPEIQPNNTTNESTSITNTTTTSSSHRLFRRAHRSPINRPLTSDENLDFQVIAIPSESNANIDIPKPDPADPNAPPPPPLPNPRSSTSIDNPLFTGVKKYRPKFSDLVEEVGFARACWRIVVRFFKDNWGILLFLLIMAIGLTLLGTLVFDEETYQTANGVPFKAYDYFKFWMSFAILIITLALLIVNALPSGVTMLLGLTGMLVFQIVDTSNALVGFSNSGVAAVAILFIVAEGIQRTSVLLPIFRVILGKPKYLWEAQIRIMLPVALTSAFLNNTPVVAMLIPVIQSWSRRAGFPVSKLLMPLNNAAILGGTLTLLGTSTNLVVDGLTVEENLLGENQGLSMFGITVPGLVMLGVGLVYILIFSRFLLKDRGQTGVGAIIRNPREYTVALLVQGRSPIVGDTVQEAGLRQLQGLYLVEVTRADGSLIPAVSPDTRIEAGDTLLFAGVVETVTELYHIPGLVPAAGQSQKMKIERHHRRLVELVISSSSMLVGKTAKESQFRSRFSAAIIAVHRQGEHVKEKIADIKLRAGDTLLVETGSDFTPRFGKDSNFALVSEVSGSQPPREDLLHMIIAALIAVAMVSAAASAKVKLMTAAAAASFLLIATRCMSLSNAGRAVNMDVILTIAASFGISEGMKASGAAAALAKVIVSVFESIGEFGLLVGIYIGTALLSAVITNNAAVTLMFPVITGIFKQEQYSSKGFILSTLYTLMIGASSSFSTPIGYQTNLMVHGPGGYTFMDWVFFGVPLQLVLCGVGVGMIYALNINKE